MNKKLFLQNIAEGISQRKGLTKKDAEQFVRTIFEIVEHFLVTDKIVKIKGFGTFKLVSVDSRDSVNIHTGERIEIKGHTKVTFTPDAVLRDHINKPFAEFETTVLSSEIDLSEIEAVDKLIQEEVSQMESQAENAEISTELSTEEDSLDSLSNENDSPEIEVDSQLEEVDVDKALLFSDNESEEETEEVCVQDEDNVVTDSPEQCQGNETSEKEVVPTTDSELLQDSEISNAVSSATCELEAETIPTNEQDAEQEKQVLNQCNDYQRVAEQTVAQQSVSSQRVEHQTIEHQNIVNEQKVDVEHKGGIHLSNCALLVLGAVVLGLMAGSYFIGYYQLLCPCRYADFYEESVTTVPAKPIRVTVADLVVPTGKNAVDTLKKDTLPADTLNHQKLVSNKRVELKDTQVVVVEKPFNKKTTPTKKIAKEIKSDKSQSPNTSRKATQYAQVPGGRYVITGTRKTVTVGPGETLHIIARREYGSNEIVPYLIIHNEINNPDIIDKGKIIKLPELKLRAR